MEDIKWLIKLFVNAVGFVVASRNRKVPQVIQMGLFKFHAMTRTRIEQNRR